MLGSYNFELNDESIQLWIKITKDTYNEWSDLEEVIKGEVKQELNSKYYPIIDSIVIDWKFLYCEHEYNTKGYCMIELSRVTGLPMSNPDQEELCKHNMKEAIDNLYTLYPDINYEDFTTVVSALFLRTLHYCANHLSKRMRKISDKVSDEYFEMKPE